MQLIYLASVTTLSRAWCHSFLEIPWYFYLFKSVQSKNFFKTSNFYTYQTEEEHSRKFESWTTSGLSLKYPNWEIQSGKYHHNISMRVCDCDSASVEKIDLDFASKLPCMNEISFWDGPPPNRKPIFILFGLIFWDF